MFRRSTTIFLVLCIWGTEATFEMVEEEAESSSPFYLLNPQDYAPIMGDDQTWAIENIPLFESSNHTLDLVYYFRWRSYRSHIHPTNNPAYPYVVTEFAPNVGWAGKYNTINCASGHHMAEAAWMRNTTVFDSYTTWWNSPDARHNYYYWWATSLKRNFDKTGNVTLLKALLPDYIPIFLQYAQGKLPTGGAAFDIENDCLFNTPGNEGQEQSISGPGCRTLIQSMMYGEASSLAAMCTAIGDTAGAAQMQAEADKWQRRVLRLWNPAINSFDTLRTGSPPRPPPPPPAPAPAGWTAIPADNGKFCCDQSACKNGHSTFLFEGAANQATCFSKCEADSKCNFVTYSPAGWCFNSQYCNTTDPFAGKPPVTWSRPKRAGAGAVEGAASASASASAAPEFASVRELASLSSPWYFQAVPQANASFYGVSWDTAFDPDGLGAPYGLRTAEKRHPNYYCGNGCCSWSGPMWPFESAKAISGAINVLNNYPTVTNMNNEKFWHMLWQYAASHTPEWGVLVGGIKINVSSSKTLRPYLFDGVGLEDFWIAETGCGDDQMLRPEGLPGPAWTDAATEGYRYNHATFMDLVLSGVVGLQPHSNGTLMVNPLVPASEMTYWAADGVALHGKTVTVFYDADGTKYKKGRGLTVWVNGVPAANSPTGQKLTVQL